MISKVCESCGEEQEGKFCTRCGSPLQELSAGTEQREEAAAIPDEAPVQGATGDMVPATESAPDDLPLGEALEEVLVGAFEEAASAEAHPPQAVPFWTWPTAGYMLVCVCFMFYTIIEIWN